MRHDPSEQPCVICSYQVHAQGECDTKHGQDYPPPVLYLALPALHFTFLGINVCINKAFTSVITVTYF